MVIEFPYCVYHTWVPLFPSRLHTTRPTAPEAPKTVATDPENDERYPGPRFIEVKDGVEDTSPATPDIVGRRPVSDLGLSSWWHALLVLK